MKIKTILKRLYLLVIYILKRLIILFLNKYSISFFRDLKNQITTEYISKDLAKCGKKIYISFPITCSGLRYIEIGNNFKSEKNLRIQAFDKRLNQVFSPRIIIGNNVNINYDCHIGCINNITIGNDVLIASRVYITDHFHGNINISDLDLSPYHRDIVSKGPVIIEDNVWIGEGVVILPDVKIGKNSIIGANSVVTKDIPPNCVVGGIPAKIIKVLSND